MPFNTGVVVASWKGGYRNNSAAVTNHLQPAPASAQSSPALRKHQGFQNRQTKRQRATHDKCHLAQVPQRTRQQRKLLAVKPAANVSHESSGQTEVAHCLMTYSDQDCKMSAFSKPCCEVTAPKPHPVARHLSSALARRWNCGGTR